MKIINHINFIILILIFSLSSCATKEKFIHSTVVPEAEGYAKINKDKNKNYRVKIEIRNLADPTRLAQPKQTYVVWMDAGEKSVRNVGQIKSKGSSVSHALKASFETVTPVKPKRIFLTAENDADIQFPGDQIILSTKK